MRWAEWGLQSYFRLLMGLTFMLYAAAAVRAGVVARWAAGAGMLYMAVGVAVGHTGFEKPGCSSSC